MSSQAKQPKMHGHHAEHFDAQRQPAITWIPDRQALADAYVYLLGRALVIRQERLDMREPGFAYNTIRCNPLGSANFVNPNLDVAYLEAWVAVDDRRCVLLDIPEIEDRYYTAQLIDEWGEVIVNINERTFPSKPFGSFALVEPGSMPRVPAGAGRIELHSSKAKLLARIELKGDPAGAVRLQKKFRLATLGMPEISRPPAVPVFDNDKLLGVEIFDECDIVLASALDVSPGAATKQQAARAVAAYATSSADARREIDAEIRDYVIPLFKDYAFTRSAPAHNQWIGGARTGNYDTDYWLRTTANYAGIWANTRDEAIYFVATRDSTGALLDGGQSYVLHFAADALPEAVVDAYWSIVLVGVPDYRVVPNSLNRYNFNSYSPLALEADGSLKITIGPAPVAGLAESNWLPSPDGEPFSLTFRAYVPNNDVKQGRWSPPPVSLIR